MSARDSVRENAYRVLALPGEATWNEIERSAKKLRHMDSWGAWSSPWDLPLLGPVRRDTDDIDAALRRLEDPALRFADRLLWFHERDAESAVAYLTPASIRDAREGWSGSSLAVAKHDAAVVGMIAALTFDPQLEDLSLWRRVLREWKDALDREDYWIEVLRIEMESNFPVPATLGEMRDLQAGAMAHVAAVLLERGPGADGLAPARALTILRDELPSSIYERLCKTGERSETATVPLSEPAAISAEPAARSSEPTSMSIAFAPQDEDDSNETAKSTAWPIAAPDPRDAPAREPEQDAPQTGKSRGTMTAHMARLRANIAAKPSPAAREEAAAVPAPAGTPIRLAREPVPTPAPAPTPPPPEREPAAASSALPQPAVDPLPPPWRPERLSAAVLISRAQPAAAPEPEPDALVFPAPAPAEPAAETPAAASTPVTWTPTRTRRPRVRHVALGAAVAAAITALVFFAPWQRNGGTAAPTATAETDPMRATLLARIEAADQAIARLLVERADNREEQEFLRGTIEDYRSLVADYDWRIANGLPYDPEGYRRVSGYLENDLARHQAAVEQARALSDRYDALLRERSSIVAQYNRTR